MSIVDLIDREGDMLNRGRPVKTLETMRKRLNNLFLHYIENPIFNPRAIEFINIPKGTSTLEMNPETEETSPQNEVPTEFGSYFEDNNIQDDEGLTDVGGNEFGSTTENMEGALPAPPMY